MARSKEASMREYKKQIEKTIEAMQNNVLVSSMLSNYGITKASLIVIAADLKSEIRHEEGGKSFQQLCEDSFTETYGEKMLQELKQAYMGL